MSFAHQTESVDEDELDHFKRSGDFKSCSESPFLGSLHLSTTGGLNEIPKLFSPPRYFGFLIAIVVLFLNVHTLVVTNVKALAHEGHMIPMSDFLWHERAINCMSPGELTPEAIIAIFELGGLAWAFFRIIKCLTYIFGGTPTVTAEYKRWGAVGEVLRETIPMLQSFSAMRVLQHISPPVAVPNFKNFLRQEGNSGNAPAKKLIKISLFILGHLLLLLFGFEAFLVKFRAVATLLQATGEPGGHSNDMRVTKELLIFLNQIMGIVQLGTFSNARLFSFVFGGVDNFIDAKERKLVRVWNASLAKLTSHAYPSPVKYLAVMLTFSDVDFQSLMLDDGKKHSV